MDLENSEFLNFVKAATECELDYLLVGGLALAMHGIPRFTQDADVWIRPSIDNKTKLLLTLESLEYESEELVRIEELDFGVPQVLRLEGPIDILTSIHFRMEYDVCRKRARAFTTSAGEILFIHINDLREAKLLSRRPKDLSDVVMIDQMLEELAKRKE
ncbi:hypothetical protein DYBT9623_03044 [Dyadobacter sp. CECT 9623]|uniref:Nucleotidyltransferase n=1 Tax=Dyadobacter linearis TaxID=2823330 RepID=A0ABM8URZ2_9BACT|nr:MULTISPECIES: hypothetical protein [unclassified Dyadobacter]MCE7058506.1 hypothetical protein [Dyadobacter sp. CY343]CAG5070499.1 hypothetical protein DYBT9623_03044 [Dyadobacter sp. CECT 9623]